MRNQFENLMKTNLKLLFLLLLSVWGAPALARAQGTAFNYQGRLTDNAVPAEGIYDLIFTLYDAEMDGNAVGAPVAVDALAVVAGQFVVALDYGAGVFTGAARWIEISVRVTGVDAYTVLTPRQAVLPTPYAIYAGSAGGVANGTVTADQLNTAGLAPAPGQILSYDGGNLFWIDPGVAAGNIWSRNGLDAFYSAGNVGIGLSSPTPGIRLEVNGNVRLHPSGGILGGFVQFGTPGGETGMSISGANRADIRFDDSTLKLLAGFGPGAMPSENGIAITTGGNVGIGTTTPLAGFRLDVSGLTRMTPGGSGGEIRFHTPSGETGMSLVGANRADVRFDGSSLKLLAGFGPGAMPSENGIAITTAGSVGIGTTTPIAKLDVENSQSGKSAVYGGVGVYGGATASSGVGVFARNLNGVAVFADGNAAQARGSGGFVKAMVQMHYDGAGNSAIPSFVRCYNGVTGATGGQCGFSYDHYVVDLFGYLHTTIDFGFTVNDRFISLTAISGEIPQGVSVFGFPNAHTIDVRNDGDFYIIVY